MPTQEHREASGWIPTNIFSNRGQSADQVEARNVSVEMQVMSGKASYSLTLPGHTPPPSPLGNNAGNA